MNNCKFQKKDLLTYGKIEEMINDKIELKKARQIANCLQSYCFIMDDFLYVLQTNMTYKKEKVQEGLIYLISLLYELSFEALDSNEYELLNMKYGKCLNSFTSINGIRLRIENLKTMLRKDKAIDYTPCEIHYNNGYYDVKELKFKKRTSEHYITTFINYDYKEPTKEDMQEVKLIFRKTYPKKEDRKLILTFVACALSWKAPEIALSLFLIGRGDSGKSTIMLAVETAFECYYKYFKNDMFVKGNSSRDKILNSHSSRRNILFSHVNEPETKKMDSGLYKEYCDGKVSTTKLYKDDDHTISFNSMLITTANNMPKLEIDTGSTRRLKAYPHMSKFVDDPKQTDPRNHVYLKDRNLKIKFEKLKCAISKMFFQYCNNWLVGKYDLYKMIKENKRMRDETGEVIDSNDYIQDFIDKHITFTDNNKDRILKDDMTAKFLEEYKNKKMTNQTLISLLKDKGLTYDRLVRKNGVRGCFVGVNLKDENFIIEEEEDIEYVNNTNEKNEKIKQLEEEIKRLKAVLNKTVDEQYKDLINDCPLLRPIEEEEININLHF